MNMAEKTTKKTTKAGAEKAAPVKKAAPRPVKTAKATVKRPVKKPTPPTPKNPVKAAKVEKKVKPKKAKPAKARGPRKLGFNIPLPTSEPEEYDANCPFFGTTSVHGRILTGTVVSAKMYRTVAVLINRKHYVQKYERYEKRRTKLLVHNPPSVNAQVGDIVRIMETRPISKTKHFVVVERIPRKLPVTRATGEKKD